VAKKGEQMQFFRRMWNRFQEWRASRRAPQQPVTVPDFTAYTPNIARDVSSQGVRFFSLCGTCGERMESSATLCDDCARKRSGFSI
jgi:hypothetical protein